MNLFKMVMTPMVERIKHRLNQIQVSHKKKQTSYFPLNPGRLMGILMLACYNPHITG